MARALNQSIIWMYHHAIYADIGSFAYAIHYYCAEFGPQLCHYVEDLEQRTAKPYLRCLLIRYIEHDR